jgi:hypothetical protein
MRISGPSLLPWGHPYSKIRNRLQLRTLNNFMLTHISKYTSTIMASRISDPLVKETIQLRHSLATPHRAVREQR